MPKVFNVNGACKSSKHYMVNLKSRLQEIKMMIDDGEYFTIHKARQYGKTTILHALADFLKENYVVISLDFQKMSSSDFSDESAFVNGLAREISKVIRRMEQVIPHEVKIQLNNLADKQDGCSKLAEIFDYFSMWCEESCKPIVLMIDEVDTAANNQVFLDFLAQLRAYYLERDIIPTFQSVILAGVYDIRNIRRKLRTEKDHKTNSPWNIAADFLVDMNFSAGDIAGMLQLYEDDYQTGMDVHKMAELLYDYTSGYSYLVSRLCKFMDERITGKKGFSDRSSAWTKEGFLDALKLLLDETNPLYQSLKGKLEDYPELRRLLYDLLFTGKPVPYTAMNDAIEVASMFGFIKNVKGTAVISNRIFETVLYNWFMSEEYGSNKINSNNEAVLK